MERDALFYPNIRIPSADWLKRTLLVFPHVARIVPYDFLPDDPREVWDFENVLGRHGQPLLRRADLMSGGVWEAQRNLTNWLREDIEKSPSFISRFGKANAEAFEGKVDESAFHIHPGKMTHDLVYFLQSRDLAWPTTGDRETRGFVKVHPLLGELIMSTLAIACAKDEGFNIVAEKERVHRCLANHDEFGAYKEFTSSQVRTQIVASNPNAEKLFEILVFQKCDPSALTPEVIGKLSDEREAIEDLKRALEGLAGTIPPMRDEKPLQRRLESVVQEALDKWKGDRANLSSFARKIFGAEGIKPAGDALKSGLEKALAVGGVSSSVLGWSAGIAIGLVVYAATSWSGVKNKQDTSPFRYLTRLEREGVVFSVSA